MSGTIPGDKTALETPETLELLIPPHLDAVEHSFDGLSIGDEELNKMLGLHPTDSGVGDPHNGTSTPAMSAGTKDMLAAIDGLPIASPIHVTLGSRKSAADITGDPFGDSLTSTSPQTTIVFDEDINSRGKSQTPPASASRPASKTELNSSSKLGSRTKSSHDDRKRSTVHGVTLESVLGKEHPKRAIAKTMVKTSSSSAIEDDESTEVAKISAYARLDFEHFTFYVQTLQVILGRRSNDDNSLHAVDVHLSSKKAISRKHAKIFYNFGTQRFELSVLGRNGAFVDDLFVEKGITVPLTDGTKIQIGDIPFSFVLPSIEVESKDSGSLASKPFNPSDAINLRSNLYHVQSPNKAKKPSKTHAKTKDNEPERRIELPTMDIEIPKIEIQEQHKSGAKNAKVAATNSTTKGSKQNKAEVSENTLTKEQSKSAAMEMTNSRRKSSFTIPKDFKDMSASSRRNSLILQRRLSTSRRKSMNPGSQDEVGEILKELGIGSIDEIGDVDPTVLDEQLLSILGDDSEFDHDNSIKYTAFNESAILEEEDEKSPKVIEPKVKLEAPKTQRSESLGLDLLDQEIATLAPLIDAHNEELLREKEANETIHDITSDHPLMGRPANPLLGKPASIQPPPNTRLYGKPLSSITRPLLSNTGLPASAIAGHGLGNNFKGIGLGNLPMNLQAGLGGNAFSKPIIPPRPPPPKLNVAVNYVTEVHPRQSSYKAITVNLKPPHPSVCLRKSNEPLGTLPKLPNKNKPIKKSKPTYNASEIPDMYKLKPNISYPTMITNVLSKATGDGLTISELHDAIRDSYPYYKYCADGWQFSVNHNLRLSKNFKRLPNKKDNEWAWVIDEAFITDKEKARKKQQEIAAARSKAAALKAEELKQKQRLEAQQAMANNAIGRGMPSPFGLTAGLKMPLAQFVGLLQNKNLGGVPIPTSIAEMASQIARDGRTIPNSPGYFKPGSIPLGAMGSAAGLPAHNATQFAGTPPAAMKTSTNIKAQLAANRAISNSKYSPKPTTAVDPKPVPGHGWSPKTQSPSSANVSNPHSSSGSPTPGQPRDSVSKLASPPITSQTMNQDTKKSLAYLQKELFVLYKARKLSYNTATTTEIITNALATTIAQVNAIGAKAGCGDNALNFLVEKAPQQVSKILDIALSKSIKEKQGTILSRQGTPGPQSPSVPGTPKIASPVVPSAGLSVTLKPSTPLATPVIAAPIPKKATEPLIPPKVSTENVKVSGTQSLLTPALKSVPEPTVDTKAVTTMAATTPTTTTTKPVDTPSTVSREMSMSTPAKPPLTTPKVEPQNTKLQLPSFKPATTISSTTSNPPPAASTPGSTMKKPSYNHPGLSKPPVFSSTPKPPSFGSKNGSTFSQMAKSPLFLSNRTPMSTTPPAGTPSPKPLGGGRFSSSSGEIASSTVEGESGSSPNSNKRKLEDQPDESGTKLQKTTEA